VSLIDGVIRHGLALNVLTELNDFALINPCGFTADTTVSIKHFKPNVTFAEYKERFARLMGQRFS
jgi:lipoate-protein ligase B